MPRLIPSILSVALLQVLASSVAIAQSESLRQPREFARGVLTTIQPDLEPQETFSNQPMVEITANERLAWEPELLPQSSTIYHQAENATFSREIWGLEISLKPLRMVTVELPRADGGFERKLLWYLVYRVQNNGDRIRPVESEGGVFTAEPAEPQPVQFCPHFVLEGQDRDANGDKIYKAYLDRVLPDAVELIRRRETPGRELLNSAEMAQRPIEVSTEAEDNSVWGVAIWERVDPETDFLSIFVRGLTNAHQWVDPAGAYQPGDPAGKGRRLAAKTLQLNYWRPGDEFLENEREIQFGVAPGKSELYGVEEGVAYRWTFR